MSDVHTSPDWYRVEDLRPRLRPDTRVARHVYLGRPWYVISDATGGKVHRVTPAAYAVIGAFDGKRSVGETWDEAVREHGEDAPTQDEVIRLLAMLHSADLMAGSDRPMLDELLERRDREAGQKIKKLLMNPLSATVPLVDPDRFLAAIVRVMGVVPRAAWWLFVVAVLLSALFLLVVNWPALANRGLAGVLDAENLFAIALIYPVVKAIHEIGHGVTIKSRGGEVHEMGVMFIVFYPIPYVDASASLMFPSKWDRMAVAAAGVIVELLIAAAALFVWLEAEPGAVRSIAFNTMLIAGFSTLVVNGNPLLKFDGYHIFTDLIEIPTLSKQGAAWWGQWVRLNIFRTVEGDRMPVTRWERFWFVVYPPVAYVYRLVVALTIALMAATTYFVVGVLLAIWSLSLGVVLPIWRVAKQAWTDHRIRQTGMRAPVTALAATGLVAVLLFVVPFPHRAIVDGVVWLPPEALVRAKSTGVLRDVAVRHGETIDEGDYVARLSAPTAEADALRAESRLRLARVSLGEATFSNRAEAAAMRESVAAAEAAWRDALIRIEDLTLRAPSSGRFDLPLAGDLEGRFVREGEVIAHVMPQGRRVVRVAIRQQDVGHVRSDLRSVSLRFADDLASIHEAELVREVPAGAFAVPSPALSVDGGGQIATIPGEGGQQRASVRLFQFDVAPTAPLETQPPFGLRAKVRFSFEPLPLGYQIGEKLRQVFLSAFAR